MHRSHHPHLNTPPRASSWRSTQGWTAWILVVLLVVAQMLFALHQLEHLATHEDSKTCNVCLVGHGLDHASVATIQIPVSPGFTAAPVTHHTVTTRAVAISAYRSRAPPLA